tara:strand:- start:284 stop:481 length:198 start_codon:yes stop_codon:yes gene_type:complete
MFPSEIIDTIYYNYIPLYMNKMKVVHEELLSKDQFLILSETYFPFELDYCFAIRIPALSPVLVRS